MFWESEKDEKENDRIAAAMSVVTDGLKDKRFYKRLFLICISGNIIIWLCILLMPETINKSFTSVYELNNKIGMAILGIPFGSALYLTYLLCRLKFPDIEENKHLNSDFMDSFNYQSDSTKRWFVWLFSIVVGVINVLLMVLINSYLSDQL